MKKIIFILASILFISYFLFNDSNVIIPKDAIRFRVIANSNSKEDQDIKYLVKNSLDSNIDNILNNANSLDEARMMINNNIINFEDTVFNTLKNNNIKQDFNVNYGINYFPEKIYNGVTYKAGNYESLVVTLGDGLGDNWWCVLFPPLCLLEAEEESNSNDVEYKFFIKEIIDRYF